MGTRSKRNHGQRRALRMTHGNSPRHGQTGLLDPNRCATCGRRWCVFVVRVHDPFNGHRLMSGVGKALLRAFITFVFAMGLLGLVDCAFWSKSVIGVAVGIAVFVVSFGGCLDE
jgi:hypothetical protein